LSRNSPIECRRINDYGQIRFAPVSFFNQVMKQPPNSGKMTQNFSDADNREIFRIDDRVAPGRSHPVATNAEDLKRLIGMVRGERPSTVHVGAQCFNQLRSIHLARSFSR